jgi:hypothetical protein
MSDTHGSPQPPATERTEDSDTGDDTTQADAPEGGADPHSPDTPAADLGDAGKQAIDRMKARVKDESAKRKAAETELAALKEKAESGDAEASAERIKAEARKEAQAEIAKERALDRVEVLAAKNFADPADARVFLAAQVDDFIDGTTIDADAITEALTELLKTRPYLAAGAPRKWTANGDGGTRGGKPKDLDAQIAEALAKGDTAAFIRLQHEKFQTTQTT